MNQTLNFLATTLVAYLPQLLAGLLVIIIGVWLSKMVKKGVARLVRFAFRSPALSQTPIEQSLKGTQLDQHLDEFVGSIAYWIFFLITLYVASGVFGLSAVTNLIGGLFAYSPKLISALVVLLLGTIFAGFVEKMVKNSFGPMDLSTARAASKIASYAVMVITVLIALSEIGIAREFILIAFVGLISALSLGFGLALGLGGQVFVRQLLEKWVKLDSKNTKAKK